MDHAGDNPYTRGVAQFVSGLRYEDIPGEVLERIKLLILDSFGCALYGTDLPWSRILIEMLSGLDISTAVGLWGTSRRLSAPHAALVNGTLVWWFRSPPYCGSAAVADFGTISHTRKQCFASVLIGSEVRKAANHSTANFRTGTLGKRFQFWHRVGWPRRFKLLRARECSPPGSDGAMP
jgi:hypothetical protein